MLFELDVPCEWLEDDEVPFEWLAEVEVPFFAKAAAGATAIAAQIKIVLTSFTMFSLFLYPWMIRGCPEL